MVNGVKSNFRVSPFNYLFFFMKCARLYWTGLSIQSWIEESLVSWGCCRSVQVELPKTNQWVTCGYRRDRRYQLTRIMQTALIWFALELQRPSWSIRFKFRNTPVQLTLVNKREKLYLSILARHHEINLALIILYPNIIR